MLGIITAIALSGAGVAVTGQGGAVPAAPGPVETRLRELFPDAGAVAPKSGQPPRYTVFGRDDRTLVGVAFITTDVTPLERGYDGPISILVGLNPLGVLAGIRVLGHHEPYGYFSLETAAFVEQFRGKSVRDPFQVGGDIDAIARATITMRSAARAVRNGARMVARSALPPPPASLSPR